MNSDHNQISSKKKSKNPTLLEKANRDRNWKNGRLLALIKYLTIIDDEYNYCQACDAVYREIRKNNDNFELLKKVIK